MIVLKDGRLAQALEQRGALMYRPEARRGHRPLEQAETDRGTAEWLPPSADAPCRYVAEWTATWLRWSLAVDEL
ncbi:hypothetical protein [Streptomyces virginiae]|uniref:hypothetical protein n=1 Tax=Streptomyces virginiae TaxID=1961 RepID=UPI0036FE9C20